MILPAEGFFMFLSALSKLSLQEGKMIHTSGIEADCLRHPVSGGANFQMILPAEGFFCLFLSALSKLSLLEGKMIHTS